MQGTTTSTELMRNRSISVARLVLFLAAAACSKDQTSRLDSTGTQASPGGTAATSAPADADSTRTLLFLGTSLTAGLGLDPDDAYPMLIQRKLDSARLSYRVVNAGVSGETSSGLLRRVDWLLQQRLDVVVIETGANDGLRGVPVETMRDNLQEIISRIRAAQPQATIALVQMEALPNMGKTYTEAFHASFPELARRNAGVVLIPFLLDGVAGVRDLNQGDGIHPNEEGERIVANNVWKALKPLLR
jgi:acyl-CoA thioesterase-1